ncbi:hypothetical protein GCM10023320_63410 [Pseudonocardia adelaidensis]|uniref:Methyltransferase domain-containing protein n=2 Tax=Pseudonocardia adelaidensis TaxID=648754 RepID=A0ABP9NZZ5_9PSEU
MIDLSEAVLEQARGTAAARGVPNVRFEPGSAYAIAADGASVDVVHAHQALLHLTDPVATLRVFLRVTRPGGVVAASDTDYGGAFWWPADPRLELWRQVYQAVARGNGSEPDAGRRLLCWARAAGATDVTPSASIWCHAAPPSASGGAACGRSASWTPASPSRRSRAATPRARSCRRSPWLAAVAEHPDAWFAIPHGEILGRVGVPAV